MSKNKYYYGSSALAVTLAMAFAAPAFAQQGGQGSQAEIDQCYADAGDDDAKLSACDTKANAVTAVVSTGSRIRGLPEDAALPVEVLGREALQDRGAPNMSDLLKSITESSSMAADGNNGATGYGDAQISLRGMGSGRTLALVNGRRLGDMVSESGFTQGNSQDISSVPMGALQQVEVLKDGGTTTYGADAVAGVINFITRRDLNGTEVNASHRFIENTAGYWEGNVLWGRRNDSGNILISVSYEHRSPLKRSERTFSKAEPFNGGYKTQASGALTPSMSYASSAGGFVMQLQNGAPTTAFGTTPAAENSFGTISYNGLQTGGIDLRYRENAGAPLPAALSVVPFGNTYQAQHIGASSSGLGRMRDIGCAQLGGFLGFDSFQAPACHTNYAYSRNLIDQLDHYNFFTDANIRLNDNVQYHNEMSLRLQRTDLVLGPSGTLQSYQGLNHSGVNPACEPLPALAPNRTAVADTARDCARSRFSNSAGSGVAGITAFNALNSGVAAWTTPGFNPAVSDYFGRFYDLAGNNRGLTEGQYELLTGASSAFTFAGTGPNTGSIYTLAGVPIQNEFGQAQLATTTAGTTFNPATSQVGRIALPSGSNGSWVPFGMGGNPAFEDGLTHANVDNYGFRTVQQLKVDFGKVFGVTLDMDMSGTYQRDLMIYQVPGILSERLQRALNGFATNLDDPDGDTCTFEETRGTRTFVDPDGTGGPLVSGTVANVGYTVGAGGGADASDYNATNFTGFNFDPDGTGPLTARLPWAGNGCYFFNPFSTATATNPYQNIQAPLASLTGGGHVAGPLAPGGSSAVGDYQGYAPGYGLANSPGIARWLYEDRSRRLTSDNVFFDFALNGDFAGLSLPGGPLGWAAGTQWRYVRREVQYDRLSDRTATPCTYRTGAVSGDPVFSGDISGSAANSLLRREDASTCFSSGTNGVGPWADGFGGNNSYRATRTVSYFGELALPFTDTVTGQIAYRWERENRNSRSTDGVGIYSGSLKWQVTPNFSLRASAGSTFDPTDVENYTINRSEGTGALGGTFAVDAANGVQPISDNTEVISVTNLGIGPETGFNYNVGVIWQTPDRRLFTSLDYFNIIVEGTPSGVSATNIGRALAGPAFAAGNIPAETVIDCTSAAAQQLFNINQEALDVGTGPRPVVAYRDATGAITTGCIPGSTFQGVLSQGLGLSIVVPDRVNAASLRASGIDGRIQYTHPDEVYGGRISVGLDVTYNVNRYNEGVFVYGLQTAQPALLLGSDVGGLVYGLYRGNLTLTYMRGNHTLTYFGQASSGYRNSVNPIIQQGADASFNYNPTAENRVLCDASLIPTRNGGADPAAMGPSGVGQGTYYAACNVPRVEGYMHKTAIISSFVYRFNMPEQRTNFTFNVENIFDREPEFFANGGGYHTAQSINPYGRNYKITIQKSF